MRVALLLLCCALWGCSWRSASAPNAAEKARDEAATVWRDVKTPHFVVRTNLDVSAAIEAGETLETERAAIIGAIWPGLSFEEGDRTEAVIYANRELFRGYFGDSILAFSSESAGIDCPLRFYTAALPARQPRDVDRLRSALVAELVTKVYPLRARWFGAGLTRFLETLQDANGGELVVIGLVHGRMLNSLRIAGPLPMRDVLAWKQPSSNPRNEAFAATSWLFVHWLYDRRPEPFARLQKELAKGTRPKRAFEIAFPDFDPEAVDHELLLYLQEDRFGTRAADKRPSARTVTERFEVRVLEGKEIHVELARRARTAAVRAPTKRRTETLFKEVTHEIAHALALDPMYVPALWLDERPVIEERRNRWRKVTEVHPDDPTAWFELGSYSSQIGDAGEAERAYRRLMDLRPRSYQGFNQLAWMMLKAGQVKEALPLAVRAFQLAPSNAAVLDTYAFALFKSDRCEEALAAQEQAVEIVSQSATHDRDYDDHLAEYQKACGME